MNTTKSNGTNVHTVTPRQQDEDFIQQIELYLDGQMSPAEQVSFHQVLSQNEHYYALLQQEQAFREFIKQKVRRREVPSYVTEDLKNKIRASLTQHPVR